MKSFVKTLLVSAVLVGVATVGLAVPRPGSVAAQDNKQPDNSSQTNTTADSYIYEAQPGDTYSQMARKAVQTYGIENKVNLSGAEIIFAETNTTIEAGSPELAVGQKVTVSKDTIKKWVESAQKLDDATEALWNYYVPFVDFNTNAVGQKS
jgi:hypothetical protein